MKHVPMIDMIELAAGHLSGDRRALAEAHLAACAACRQKYQEHGRVSSLLGDWAAQPPGIDINAALQARLNAPGAGGGRSRWLMAARLSRYAASIVIGVAGGYAAARWVAPPGPFAPAPPRGPNVAADPDVEWLEIASPTGFWGSLAEFDERGPAGEDVP